MKRDTIVNVTGGNGLRGTIDTAEWPLDGSRAEVMVRLDDGRKFMTASENVTPEPGGGYRLRLEGTDLSQLSAALERAAGATVAVPVIAEELAVGKRVVETGRVRLTKVVHEEQQVVDQPLFAEEVVVERVPVNRVVDAAPAVRHEGETMVVPLLEEVLVVEKRLMLREEVRVTRRRTETHQPQTVTLRKEEVNVERIPPGNGRAGTDVATD